MYCTMNIIGNRFLQSCSSDTLAFQLKTKTQQHKLVRLRPLAVNLFFKRRLLVVAGIALNCIDF
ncbi:hypothetical protein GALL_62110 [mine drainage metagenome]|uniref:Uncharacterized protein n=1 Tax=mine drainage metagenome TaxID=410659 RepID=A0A1J5T8F7_9ZZZZ